MINNNADVDILMATYNGEKYIEEQLESVLRQTYSAINIIIRDDGSTDGTVSILNKYKNIDSRIKIITDDKNNLGYSRNFEELLKNSNSKYIMFADQDDVWLELKVEKMLKEYKKHEIKNKYLIVHSDCYVVDEYLNIISEFLGKKGEKKGVKNIIFNPVVQGASMMIGLELKELLLPFPKVIGAYDFYFSLITEAVGKRVYINEKLMYYRQHSNNQIGVEKKNKIRKKRTRIYEINFENSIIGKRRYNGLLAIKEKKISMRIEDIKIIDDVILLESLNGNKIFKVITVLKYINCIKIKQVAKYILKEIIPNIFKLKSIEKI